MNNDLQKALNADFYPNIKIELLEVREKGFYPKNECTDWLEIQALTKVFINGHVNQYWLDISAFTVNSNNYRFIGEQSICLSDFCVEAPTALLGLVQVRDEIAISLDLNIKVNN